MLMFQSGLLATFIPEIFMVIGFVFCLFTSGLNSKNSTIEKYPESNQNSISVQNTPVFQQHSVYQFQTSIEFVHKSKQIAHLIAEKQIFTNFEFAFLITKVIDFVEFSRPPPCLLY
jgi:hypothetical protein